jgi:ferric-dicitrate binding protein FerR (iron transport regulator)
MEETPADRASALIFNCLIDKSTESEKEELIEWFRSNPAYRVLLDWLDDEDQIIKDITLWRSIDPEKAYEKWVAQQRGGVNWRRIALAVAACLVAAVLLLWLLKPAAPVKPNAPAPIVMQDRPPGHTKGILRLANERTIYLDSMPNGLLAIQGNTELRKTDSGSLSYIITKGVPSNALSFNTLTVPRGGYYTLRLPDGTKVWLNNASQLKYPVAFTGTDRTVELTGEAYFEVAKDPGRPFMVKAGDVLVEVLGTNFNIMAYADEKIVQTTLLSGKVQLHERNNKTMLHPGQQAVVENQSGAIRVVAVDAFDAIAWKDGYFHFKRTDLGSVMRQLGRWYDMEVVMQRPAEGHLYDGKIKKNLSLLEILSYLQYHDVHFSIMDNRLIVSQ